MARHVKNNTEIYEFKDRYVRGTSDINFTKYVPEEFLNWVLWIYMALFTIPVWAFFTALKFWQLYCMGSALHFWVDALSERSALFYPHDPAGKAAVELLQPLNSPAGQWQALSRGKAYRAGQDDSPLNPCPQTTRQQLTHLKDNSYEYESLPRKRPQPNWSA